MNNMMSVGIAFKEPHFLEDSLAMPSMEEKKILDIRQASNVVQALENVIRQCDSHPDYADLKGSVQNLLHYSQKRMLEYIHQP